MFDVRRKRKLCTDGGGENLQKRKFKNKKKLEKAMIIVLPPMALKMLKVLSETRKN